MRKHSPGKVLEFIIEYKRSNNGNSPSVAEISDACAIPSTSNVWMMLVSLREQGLIDWTVNIPRSITVSGGEWRMNVESWRSGHNQAQAEVERLQAQKNKVMEILSCFGQVDGDHHKSWVIDQVARGLTGEGYQDFVREYCNDGEYTWDTGMAP